MVCGTDKDLKLNLQAIDPNLLYENSLRDGGAMAIKLHGYDDTTITKIGRWKSLIFSQYIHNQISHHSKDILSKISICLPLVNVAAI